MQHLFFWGGGRGGISLINGCVTDPSGSGELNFTGGVGSHSAVICMSSRQKRSALCCWKVFVSSFRQYF